MRFTAVLSALILTAGAAGAASDLPQISMLQAGGDTPAAATTEPGVKPMPPEGDKPAGETPAETGPAPRPGDAEAKLPPSDGIAECAAMLAIGSTHSKNFVQRDHLKNAASAWFAKSGDVAASEGGLPEADLWEKKIADWSGKIGSVDALTSDKEWAAYCAGVGKANGLDVRGFEGG